MSLHRIKAAAMAALGRPPLTQLFAPLLRGKALIFMLHRLEDRESNIVGRDPAILRRTLAELRKRRVTVLDLEELFARLRGEGPPVDGAVAFTVDDGTRDTMTQAAPIFAEYDCPATVFLVTGYLDGTTWLWWDQIEFVFQTTTRPSLTLSVGPSEVRYVQGGDSERRRAASDFIERCKEVSNEQRLAAMAALREAAEVDVPRAPPPAYAPMTWDDVRACEKRGMRFGPHTVTHGLLSQLPDEGSRWEIEESWRRVSAEVSRPTPLFCYPNGRSIDYGARELSVLAGAGIRGGVAGVPPGYAERAPIAADPTAIYGVPRLDFPSDPARLSAMLSGLVDLRQRAQRRLRRFA